MIVTVALHTIRESMNKELIICIHSLLIITGEFKGHGNNKLLVILHPISKKEYEMQTVDTCIGICMCTTLTSPHPK